MNEDDQSASKEDLIATKDDLIATKDDLIATKGDLTATMDDLTAIKDDLLATFDDLTCSMEDLKVKDQELERDMSNLKNPPFVHACGAHYSSLSIKGQTIPYSSLLYSSTNTEGGDLDVSTGIFSSPYPGPTQLLGVWRLMVRQGILLWRYT